EIGRRDIVGGAGYGERVAVIPAHASLACHGPPGPRAASKCRVTEREGRTDRQGGRAIASARRRALREDVSAARVDCGGERRAGGSARGSPCEVERAGRVGEDPFGARTKLWGNQGAGE